MEKKSSVLGALLESAPVAVDEPLAKLEFHKENSAGDLMTGDFFAFSTDLTIGEAATYIRDNPRIDLTKGIYILDQMKVLQGFVPARNMIISSPDTPLSQVMRPVIHKVNPAASREEVIELVERHKIASLPVVDENQLLMGVITYEDIVEVMEDLADETVALMAGTEPKTASHEPIFKRFLARSPWLTVTLLAGLVNVGIMSSFQQYEGGILTFALFFVPLINGLSGNIGLQCSTVLVRGMALGTISGGNRSESIRKELLSGLFIGTIFGLCCGFIVYSLESLGSIGSSPLAMAIIVGSGLIGGCFAGTLLGVFSPFLFAKVGVDPAISSGPIVTAFNDFLSMTIYFLIAWGVSNFFF